MGSTGDSNLGTNSFLSVGSLASGYMQYSAANAMADYQKQTYAANADFARLQAADAIKRGEVDAARYRNRVSQTAGAGRAAMAAQGIDISNAGDSAAEITKQTWDTGLKDVQTIKNNAWRTAWGYKSQALQYESQGRFQSSASRFSGQMSLLGGGIQAVSYGAKAWRDLPSFSSGNNDYSGWDRGGA